MAQGRSGLLHANTGTGKTLAAWLGALQALRVPAPPPARSRAKAAPAPPLSVLWLTPMRALAADTTRALHDPLAELAPARTIGLRSGDTTSAERSAQDRRLPTVLVTTPESLTLQLALLEARPDWAGAIALHHGSLAREVREWVELGLVACHHPQRVAAGTVLAGHWHPAVTLRGPARDHQRLACFCLVETVLVLPAFGAFTGSGPQAPPVGSVCYPVGDGRVWPALRIAQDAPRRGVSVARR